MNRHKTEFLLSENDAGRRFDRVVRKFLESLPLSRIYTAIRKGDIRVNGMRVSPDYRTKTGDAVLIACNLLSDRDVRNSKREPAAARKKTQAISGKVSGTAHDRSAYHTPTHKPNPIAIPLLLETADLLIVNKPAGISVHGDSSVQSLLFGNTTCGTPTVQPCLRTKDKPIHSLSFRPGPLHRLDKGTTGIVCFSQTLAGAQWFSRCLREKTVDKYYVGLVRGAMPTQRIVTEDTENGSMATESYAISYSKNIDASLMLFKLITGKKHQIRKHVQGSGHPLVGDLRYGGGSPIAQHTGYFLHAWRLSFPPSRPVDLPAFIEAPPFPKMKTFLAQAFPTWEEDCRGQIRVVGSF